MDTVTWKKCLPAAQMPDLEGFLCGNHFDGPKCTKQSCDDGGSGACAFSACQCGTLSPYGSNMPQCYEQMCQ
jgi:hypothetical protein